MNYETLKNIQCVFCKSTDFELKSDFAEEMLQGEALECKNCKRNFPSVFGLPYLGSFGPKDIISLIEISSFSSRFTSSNEDGKLTLVKHKGLDYLDWIKAIEEYTQSDRPEGVLKKYFNLDEEPSWFPNRLREHLSFTTVTQDIDFKGKEVLDIGAGSGFDSLKYFHRGANVTAMEFNPILAAVGKINFPQIRWIGGSSYTLPFADNSFDFVTANATLHHLLDIPRSMEEMLRVLRPGGKIITISDSYTAQGTSETAEARIFNNHQDVLLGLNEQAPSFDKFVKVLVDNKEQLEVKFYTHTVEGVAPYSRSWTFDEGMELLPKTNGYFASILIEKKKALSFPLKMPEGEVISPYQYTTSLIDQPTAMNMLAEKIPKEYVDHKILSADIPKFRLMNGWKLPEQHEPSRKLFKRGRLFFTSEKIAGRSLHTKVSCNYHPEFDSPCLSIHLNNSKIFSCNLTRGITTPISIKIPESILEKSISVIEFRLQSQISQHEANIVNVGEIQWDGSEVIDPELNESYGIETLLEKRFFQHKELTLLLSTEFKHSLAIINRIRKYSKQLRVIIPAGQEDFYSWIPNLSIEKVYPDYNVYPEKFMSCELDQNTKIDLMIADNEAHTLILRKKFSSTAEASYLIHGNGTARSIY